jgi:glycosyltransferase 2 family protein
LKLGKVRAFQSKPKLLFGIKVALGGLLLLWLVGEDHLDWKTLVHLESPQLLFIPVFIILASFILGFLRWMMVAHMLGITLKRDQAAWLFGACLLGNLFLPSGLGSDGMKVYHLRNIHPDMKPALMHSLVVDRILGLSGLLGLTLTMSLPVVTAWKIFPKQALTGVLIAAFLFILVCWLFQRKIGHFLRRFHWLKPLALLKPYTLMFAVLLGLAGHFLYCGAFTFEFYILGKHEDWFDLLPLAPLVMLSYAIPLTPMGLGIAEGTASFLFSHIGIANGAEAAFLNRMLAILASLLAALLLFRKNPFAGKFNRNR